MPKNIKRARVDRNFSKVVKSISVGFDKRDGRASAGMVATTQ